MTDLPAQPRIAPLPPHPDDARQLNIFRTLAHSRELYKGFLALGGHLLGGDALPARERALVRLRFEEDLSQSEIGRRLGLSQMHVSRLLRRALARMEAIAAGGD